MGIKVIKKFFSEKKIYFCDRCGYATDGIWPYMLCDSCYNTDSQTIRPQTIKSNIGAYFFDEPYIFCSVCHKILGERMNVVLEKCKIVCERCISKHPDTTHYNDFKRDITFFLEKGPYNKILTNHCGACKAALVIMIEDKKVTYRYYKVGSKEYSEEPLICSGLDISKESNCVHDWIMLAGSKQNKGAPLKVRKAIMYHPDPLIQWTLPAYHTDQVYWCYRCGLYRQVPSEKLPVKGYT